MINLANATLLTLLLALSFSMQTSAQTTAANNAQTAASIPRKADGSVDFDKWFVGKSSQEIKLLSKVLQSRSDKEGFADFLDRDAAKLEAENALKEKTIQAYIIIDGIQKKLLKSELITDADMANFKIAANTPGVDLGLILRMKKLLGIN